MVRCDFFPLFFDKCDGAGYIFGTNANPQGPLTCREGQNGRCNFTMQGAKMEIADNANDSLGP